MPDQPRQPPAKDLMTYRMDQLEDQMKAIERRFVDLDRGMKDLETARITRERNLWYTGIATLGSIVLGLIAVIWANLSVIFKGG